MPEEGIIRLELAEGWTLSEFGLVISKLDRAYLSLAVLTEFTESPGNQQMLTQIIGSQNEEDYTRRDPAELSEGLRALARFRFGHARVYRVQMGSPGFFEGIGNLNPLKNLVDLINAWRHENTEREKIRLEHIQQKRALEIEESTTRAQMFEYVAANYRRRPEEVRPKALRFMTNVMEDLESDLAYVAKNERIKEVGLRKAA